MDLLLIVRKLWRYRFVTIPVVALTFLGAIYVVAVKSPEYKVSSSYVLINPPPPPTADQIALNPKLGRINPNNPYTQFSDQSVIVSLLSSSLSADAIRKQLVAEGADSRYTVAPDLQLGYSSLVVQIEGVGSTPQAAVHTAQLVGAALSRELERVQASQGVDPRYRIKAQQVVAPDSPSQQLSSTLRPLVGVFAIGAILLLLAVSGAEALESLRTEWRERGLSGGGRGRGSVDAAANGNGRHDVDQAPVQEEAQEEHPRASTNGSTSQKQQRRKQARRRRKARSRA